MSNELYNTIARVTDGIYEGTYIHIFQLFYFIQCYLHNRLEALHLG